MRIYSRILVGSTEKSFKIQHGIVVGVPLKSYVWALGRQRHTLISWLDKHNIPWHEYGFKPRKSDNFILS